jgi:hypothetical protein
MATKPKSRKVRIPGTTASMVVTPVRAGGIPLMSTRTHGQVSRRTERRKARQQAQARGWDA